MINYVRTGKAIEMLEALQQKCIDKQAEISEKMEAIEEKACDADRDLTRAEQDRYDTYEGYLSDLDAECDEIQNAIDYLMDYSH